MTTYQKFLLLVFIVLQNTVLRGQGCTPVTALPTICITTSGPIESKETYVEGVMEIIEGTGTPTQLYSGAIDIRGRGNSTWELEKKPYRIRLKTAATLPGMSAVARNWVLLANHADKTLMRNAIALDLSSYLGMPYSSPFRFVDVILNGVYVGAYMMTDHMEAIPGRVDIEQGEPEVAPGAYLVELDGFAWLEDFYIRTTQGLIATIKYPDLKSPQDEAKINAITAHINDFEALLFSDNPGNPPGSYLSKIDLPSLVNWYLACEITGNSDAFWSVYIHKRKSDDRIYLGPLWDFDIAFDNDDRIQLARNRLMADVGHDHIFRRWIVRLRSDDAFMSAVKTRWNELKAGGLKQYLLDRVDEYEELLTVSGSQQENFETWTGALNNKIYREVFTSGTYEEHVGFLKEYLMDRLDWLDREINGIPSNYQYQIQDNSTGKSLAAATSGNGVVERTYVEQGDFLWQIKPLPNGFFQIFNSGKQMALSGSQTPGSQLTLAPSDPQNMLQQWRITETSPNVYAIANRQGSLGIQSSGNSEGSAVNLVNFNSYSPSIELSEIQHWLGHGNASKWQITAVGGALPIRLEGLSANTEENAIRLSWSVSEEVNGSHFEIERLGENNSFQRVGEVKLQPNQGNRYTWVDGNPLDGINYYRLRMVDKDGSAEYSRVVSASFALNSGIMKIYPNPSQGVPVLEFVASQDGEAQISVFNAGGLKVKEQIEYISRGKNLLRPKPGKLPAGVYFVRVNTSGQLYSGTFVAAP